MSQSSYRLKAWRAQCVHCKCGPWYCDCDKRRPHIQTATSPWLLSTAMRHPDKFCPNYWAPDFEEFLIGSKWAMTDEMGMAEIVDSALRCGFKDFEVIEVEVDEVSVIARDIPYQVGFLWGETKRAFSMDEALNYLLKRAIFKDEFRALVKSKQHLEEAQ